MKKYLLSYWVWIGILIVFIGIILWDDKIEDSVKNTYVKHRMLMHSVNFSEMDMGFKHAKMYADSVDMDDSQNNMTASNVRTLFYKKDVATWSGVLLSDRGMKNPFEAKFWGNVRGWTTDKEKIKSTELRYYFNRKELFTQEPVTIWKQNTVISGIGLRYNTQTKEANISRQVLIRVWDENASGTDQVASMPSYPEHKKLIPIAPPPSQLLVPIKTVVDETQKVLTDIASYSGAPTKENEVKKAHD